MLKPTINQWQQYQQQAGANKPTLYQGNGTMMTASLSQWQQHFSTSCCPTSDGLWNAFFGKQQSTSGNRSSEQGDGKSIKAEWLEQGFATICCSAILK